MIRETQTPLSIAIFFICLPCYGSCVHVQVYLDGATISGRFGDLMFPSDNDINLLHPQLGSIDFKDFYVLDGLGANDRLLFYNRRGYRGLKVFYRESSCVSCPRRNGILHNLETGLVQDSQTGLFLYVDRTDIEYAENTLESRQFPFIYSNTMSVNQSTVQSSLEAMKNVYVAYTTRALNWSAIHTMVLENNRDLVWHYRGKVTYDNSSLNLDNIQSMVLIADNIGTCDLNNCDQMAMVNTNGRNTIDLKYRYHAKLEVDITASFYTFFKEAFVSSYDVHFDRYNYTLLFYRVFHAGTAEKQAVNEHGYILPVIRMNRIRSMPAGQAYIYYDDMVFKTKIHKTVAMERFRIKLPSGACVEYWSNISADDGELYSLVLTLTNHCKSPSNVTLLFRPTDIQSERFQIKRRGPFFRQMSSGAIKWNGAVLPRQTVEAKFSYHILPKNTERMKT